MGLRPAPEESDAVLPDVQAMPPEALEAVAGEEGAKGSPAPESQAAKRRRKFAARLLRQRRKQLSWRKPWLPRSELVGVSIAPREGRNFAGVADLADSVFTCAAVGDEPRTPERGGSCEELVQGDVGSQCGSVSGQVPSEHGAGSASANESDTVIDQSGSAAGDEVLFAEFGEGGNDVEVSQQYGGVDAKVVATSSTEEDMPAGASSQPSAEQAAEGTAASFLVGASTVQAHEHPVGVGCGASACPTPESPAIVAEAGESRRTQDIREPRVQGALSPAMGSGLLKRKRRSEEPGGTGAGAGDSQDLRGQTCRRGVLRQRCMLGLPRPEVLQMADSIERCFAKRF